MQSSTSIPRLPVDAAATAAPGAMIEAKATSTGRAIPFGFPMIGAGEREAVMEVLSGATLTHGPRVKLFEREFASYTGSPNAVATSSCASALHLAYLQLDLRPGDEVIVPAQTHVATAHAVELCGGRCVFVDSEPGTGNIDIDQLESRITPRTRAIAVVHFLGLPVDMVRVCTIARRHGLMVIEDCALAIGATLDGVHVGLFGDAGCFSFYPAKHITTGEGGMIISRSDDLAARAARQRAFGIDRNIVADRQLPGVYDVQELGTNYRMSEVEAAMGIEQLRRLPGFLAARAANHAALAAGVRDIDEIECFTSSHGRFSSAHYCLSLLLKPRLAAGRSEIVRRLTERGVGVSIYYPSPVPHMSYYRCKYSTGASAFPVARRISESSVALPVGPHVQPDDIRHIVASIKDAIAATNKA